MSSSIAIPKRKQPVYAAAAPSYPSSSSSSSFYASDSPSSSPPTPDAASPAVDAAAAAASGRMYDGRRSLLGSSLSKAEHTVINVGHSDMPRLITCVKSSQGFEWNQELFLPSYIEYDAASLELKQDPIEDITLTEEEVAAMLPQ
ncbi:hypothetical protein LTR66_003600 [Elasticomyces elasticus]|nr:hypothetical protein LTR66_003600 [Elasticomyces elasticus]